MIIKILGSRRANCHNLPKNNRAAVAGPGLDVTVRVVTHDGEIVGYGIRKAPGLVVQEEALTWGRGAQPAEISEPLHGRSRPAAGRQAA